jgi:hypothetical protein
VIGASELPICPPGPWISAGGRPDYEDWPDRERFVELDRMIAAGIGSTPTDPRRPLSETLGAIRRRWMVEEKNPTGGGEISNDRPLVDRSATKFT